MCFSEHSECIPQTDGVPARDYIQPESIRLLRQADTIVALGQIPRAYEYAHTKKHRRDRDLPEEVKRVPPVHEQSASPSDPS